MPQFNPGSVHVATPVFSNPKSAGFDYQAALCMGAAWTVMASASFHLDARQSKPVTFSVTMPTTPGTYPVYFKVWCKGVLIGTFGAAEPVVITEPVVEEAFVDIVSITGPYYDGWAPHYGGLPEGIVEFAYDITYRIDNAPVYDVQLLLTDGNGVGGDAYPAGAVGLRTARVYPNPLWSGMRFCEIHYRRTVDDVAPHWVQLEYVLQQDVWVWVPGPHYRVG